MECGVDSARIDKARLRSFHGDFAFAGHDIVRIGGAVGSFQGNAKTGVLESLQCLLERFVPFVHRAVSLAEPCSEMEETETWDSPSSEIAIYRTKFMIQSLRLIDNILVDLI
jgi:hypothetical protein